VSASANLPLHHKVQKFSSGTGSPGWSWKKGRKCMRVRVRVCVEGRLSEMFCVILCTITMHLITSSSCRWLLVCSVLFCDLRYQKGLLPINYSLSDNKSIKIWPVFKSRITSYSTIKIRPKIKLAIIQKQYLLHTN